MSQEKVNAMFEHSKRFFAIPRDVRESVRRPPSGFDARGWVRPGSGNVTQGIWDKDAVIKAQKESASEFELYLVGSKCLAVHRTESSPESQHYFLFT